MRSKLTMMAGGLQVDRRSGHVDSRAGTLCNRIGRNQLLAKGRGLYISSASAPHLPKPLIPFHRVLFMPLNAEFPVTVDRD